MVSEKQAYLSFNLNDELFAVSVHKVLEVLQKQQITKIPKAPKYIEGVINFRGEILPVVDTRKKFDMPEMLNKEKYVIIVLELFIKEQKILLGAIVDSVRDVLNFSDEQIKSVPDLGLSYNTDFIKGMIRTNNGFTIILNMDKVFSVEDVKLHKTEITEQTEVNSDIEEENSDDVIERILSETSDVE